MYIGWSPLAKINKYYYILWQNYEADLSTFLNVYCFSKFKGGPDTTGT